MRSHFIRTKLAMFVAAAAAIAATTASAQCTFSVPSSQILTNTLGDAFSASITFAGLASPSNNVNSQYIYRKNGSGFGDFGPWILTQSGSGSGGWFTQNSSGNGGGNDGNHIGYSWGLWANGGELINATRVLTPTNAASPAYDASYGAPAPFMVLPVGVTFQIDMDNGYVSSGDSTGIGLQNAEGQTLWEWYFAGGGSAYVYHDNAGYNSSSLGWTDQGMHIAFTLTSSNTYSATITPVSGSGSITVSGTVISNSDYGVVQARSWNYSAGSGSAYDFFVNNISILDKSDNANTSTYLSPRSWTSGDGSGWDFATTGTNSGFFTASAGSTFSAAQLINNNAWGLYANSGNVADAIRPFGEPVYVSNSVFVAMQNGMVGSGGSVGFGLQSGATNRFEFFFTGGGTDYLVNDGSGANRDTGIGWTNVSMLIQFTLTSSNAYSLSATYDGSTNPVATITGSLEGATNSLIDRVRLFNANAGTGSAYDLVFTFLAMGSYQTLNLENPNVLFGGTATGAMKYDQGSFYGSASPYSWASGMDNGYSILAVDGNSLGDIVTHYTPTMTLQGGRDLQGCYDLFANFCYPGPANSSPWYVKVFNQ